ncbi:hypothetical protein HT031_000084 [Scenedesmus sp. PABB004]|nr:hypothetical protein HT031_000084 [Scenedesmus sp. PABB004]
MAPRPDFVFEAPVPEAALSSPRELIKASLFEGKLRLTIAGDTQEVALPEDAFVDDASARLAGRTLTEKRLFNPDRHPVELDVALPKELINKLPKSPLSPAHADKTPAQTSAGEFSDSLIQPSPPTAGRSAAVARRRARAQGGAMDTVSQGETVTRVPGSTDVRHLTGLVESPGGAPPSAEELACRLRDTAVHDLPPPGASVEQGARPFETEATYDEAAAAPARPGAAPAPAGDDDEARALATGARGEKVRSDYVGAGPKVGMEYVERTAAAAYVGSVTGAAAPPALPGRRAVPCAAAASAAARRPACAGAEPISSLKTPGAALCDLCGCAPCQCHHMRRTGGAGNNPYEFDPHHVGVGARLADFKGNVPEGHGDAGDPRDVGAAHAAHGAHGATHAGGAPIEMGGPGKRHGSEAASGARTAGGHKTTFPGALG